MAGINAHQFINDEEPLVLRRDQGYIGVLIDDLITKSVDEPYRMFTSRAEYRILLRQDNADTRLTPIGYKLGLATQERYNRLIEKENRVAKLVKYLKETNVNPEDINGLLVEKETPEITNKTRFAHVLTRPQIGIIDMINHVDELKSKLDLTDVLTKEVAEEAEILIKYEGYIEKEREVADKLKRLEDVKLSPDFDYNSLHSLTIEARQKLTRHKPQTLGQASRISGVSPADISVLAVFLGR